jgi:tetratricopeptide (TPR) repeat protein
MPKLISAFVLFYFLGAKVFAQGWTPFIPPPSVPDQGVPFLKDDPAYPKYSAIYGEMQENFGSSDEANKAGQAIMQLQKDYPQSPYPFFALAELKYMMAGGGSSASVEVNVILDKVLRRNGANLPDGYILKAKMAAQANQKESALEYANIAIRFAPTKPEAQFALARAEEINKDYPKAEDAYRKFITLESSALRQANAYEWLGDMFSGSVRARADREANRAKAMEAYRKSAELGPTYRHINAYATFLLTSMGDAVAAAPYFTRMLQQDPDDDEAKFYLGLTDYLKWAKANPTGASVASLDVIQKRSGLSKEDAFVISAKFDGLAIVTSALLRSKAIKNLDVVCSSMYQNLIWIVPAIVNASYSDNFVLVKELAEHGANVNAQGFERRTPLMYALFATDVDMVSYLLKKGARVNVAADDGLTPMAVAVAPSPKSQQLVSLLLKHKADPMGVAGSGQTLAFTAVMGNNIGALEALITEGKVDVNLKNSDQLNLLYYALGNPDMLHFLLSKGADPWQKVQGGDLIEWAKASTRPAADTAITVAILEEARKKTPQK